MSEQKQTEKKPTEAPATGDEIQRQLLEAALEANRLKRLELGVAAEDPKAKLFEADRLVEEQRQAVAALRGEEQRIRMRVRLTSDLGPLELTVTAICFKDATDEPHKNDRGSPRGRLRVQNIWRGAPGPGLTWDDAEARELIRKHHLDAHASGLEDLARNGHRRQLDEAVATLDRGAIRNDVWKLVTLPTLRLLVDRLVDDLVASGAVTIVEPAAQ
jgi:hypothetical protein